MGTIMALMVFLAFLGLFTNQFVPVWMSDNESTHMSEAIQQFLTLKSQIDMVVTGNANSLIAPTPLAMPITLSAPGIPVFAGPTAGVLSYSPRTELGYPSFNVSYAADGYTLGPANDGHSGGVIDLNCPNRYYVGQHVIYEGGAVIINQSDGEYIIAGLQFSVSDGTSSTDTEVRTVRLTQVSLLGLNKTVGGIGSKIINADLLYADTSEYQNDDNTPLQITVVSKHGYAWYTYFSSALNSSLAGLTYGDDFTLTITKYDMGGPNLDYYQVVVTIMDVNVLDHTHATVEVSLGDLGR